MKGESHFPVLVPLFALLIVIVIVFTYYRYVIQGDFIMNVVSGCDPTTEKCFLPSCSSAEDPSCPPGPYKKIVIRSGDAPRCLENHSCEHFACDNTSLCTETYCSDAVLEDGESCAP
ncbi:MAG: hypothetical protein JWN18_371 [Parcubacteria group bacterium]|nr:hypothetical protein [Parcubacteria group bacterium]